ncbi:hypothetical protein Q3G72_011473 [Acer saccharum]|nr:hypothetical protein Q3G72_011473 [Acer saccharum]
MGSHVRAIEPFLPKEMADPTFAKATPGGSALLSKGATGPKRHWRCATWATRAQVKSPRQCVTRASRAQEMPHLGSASPGVQQRC